MASIFTILKLNNGEDLNALSFEEMEDNESEIESDIVCGHGDDEISLFQASNNTLSNKLGVMTEMWT
ncbi:hypothetical protein P8452_38854 [Trifolium repens]|nr:hypothetical protein P8452_38854 [Trifolium repens]